MPNRLVKDYLERVVAENATLSVAVARLKRKVQAAQEEAQGFADEAVELENDLRYAKAEARNLEKQAEALEKRVEALEKRPVDPPDVAALRQRLAKAEAEASAALVDFGTLRRQAADLGQARKDCDLWAERCDAAENLLRGFLQEAEGVAERAKAHLRKHGENVA